jgi:hypothetical protein
MDGYFMNSVWKIGLFLVLLFLVIRYVFLERCIRWRLRRLAVDLFHVLNETRVQYWADFGTLLGIHREGDIILGDNDVDVCVMNVTEQQMHTIGHWMTRLGYCFRPYLGVSISLVYSGSVHADIYHVRRSEDEGDEILGATGPNSNIPAHLIGDEQGRYWWARGGVHVKVPCDVKGTLIWRYGTDYMVPRRDFKGRDP